MDKKAAQNLVKETLECSFDKEQFTVFIKNFLNHIEETPQTIYRGNYIPDAYKDYIKTIDRIGKYQDPEGKKLDILIIELKKETSLERARTRQRNCVAWYLKDSRGVSKDAALVAFVSPNEDDWRFSFVKMEYKLGETLKGNLQAKEEFTPARRFSFLVGKNEYSHTAQSRLAPLLVEDEIKPTIADLEDAFGIEKVTKKFFENYRQLFLILKESLDEIVQKDKRIKADFEARKVDTVDFAKKLLGQIVFLYFLQKKGWFGVKRGQPWGSGSKHFLRELFEKRHGNYKNFFNDILEPLFYEALRLERPGDYYSRFDCRIPFLNGGLFDPINDYDWVETDILLPNELFSNIEKTKQGDIGTGILDVFDRYNFTVKEDEPLEKEVAVDPEMLGKVFENLLEVKDRKSKGTYYTPREIVHYMCQESLANYLATELDGKVSKEDIETLIKYGESVVEHDSRVVDVGRETERYSFKLPESIRKHAKLIDEKLASIRVCDPAVGSGAFPVGMMSEIIRTRNALTPYLSSSPSRRDGRGEDEIRSAYNFKRQAIQNCLYGVDIDPGAVEIAKLRLWLSLIVDEEEREKIQPLPNLDYKIMQGNSLIELTSYTVTTDQKRNEIVNRMKNLKDELFGITSPEAKEKKRNEIDNLIKQLFEHDRNKETEELERKIWAITAQGKLFEDKRSQREDEKKINEYRSKIEEIKNLKIPRPTEHFEWHINFSEVFHEKKGFDVVIANPPYVRQEKIKDQKATLQNYEVYNATSDLYTYFYERSYNILKNNGVLTFISSNKWMRAKYGEKLRRFFGEKTKILQLIDFNGHKVFEATVDTNIIVLQKEKPTEDYIAPFVNIQSDFTGENLDQYLSEHQQSIRLDQLHDSGWSLVNEQILKIKEKVERMGTPLKDCGVRIYRGIVTGLIEAFIIDEQKKRELIKTDIKNSDIMRPLLKGKNIERYFPAFNGRYIILAKNGIDIKQEYPSIFEYLAQFKKKLEKRWDKGSHWSNLRDCDYYEEFEKPKIIYPDISDRLSFAYDDNNYYADNTAYILGTDSKYILAVLNSSLINFYYGFVSSQLGSRAVRHFTIYIEKIPIKQVSDKEEKSFIALVNRILAITKDDDYLENTTKQAKVREYEKQIDKLVYKLYGLTEEEIKIVDPASREASSVAL